MYLTKTFIQLLFFSSWVQCVVSVRVYYYYYAFPFVLFVGKIYQLKVFFGMKIDFKLKQQQSSVVILQIKGHSKEFYFGAFSYSTEKLFPYIYLLFLEPKFYIHFFFSLCYLPTAHVIPFYIVFFSSFPSIQRASFWVVLTQNK